MLCISVPELSQGKEQIKLRASGEHSLYTTCLPHQPQACSLHSALATVHLRPSKGSKGHPQKLACLIWCSTLWQGHQRERQPCLVHKEGHSSTVAYRNIYSGLNSSFPMGQPGLQAHSMSWKHRDSRMASLAPGEGQHLESPSTPC